MNKRTWGYITWAWISLPFILLFLYKIGSTNPEILKILIGTFSGAALAFFSNSWFKYESRKREELSEGLRALYTIRSQFDDFVNVRFATHHHMNVMAEFLPDETEWCYAKPMAFNFNSSNVFDFKSLSFLLSEKTGRSAYERLQFIERTYLDLMARYVDLNDSAKEIQKMTSEVFQKKLLPHDAPFDDMEKILGPELPARVKSNLQAVVIRIARDEQRYLKAFNALKAEMKRRFGDVVEMSELIIPEKFKKDNLPPFPKRLSKYLDEIPNEIED